MIKQFNFERGFTLIELLIVIAIIGILASIVFVGLNPAARIREANTARAQSELRQAGSVIEQCITGELIKGRTEASIYQVGDSTDGCGDLSFLTANNYSKVWPPTLTISLNQAGGDDSICLNFNNENVDYYYSSADNSINSLPPADCPPSPYTYP